MKCSDRANLENLYDDLDNEEEEYVDKFEDDENVIVVENEN